MVIETSRPVAVVAKELGINESTRTLQAIARDRNRLLDYLPL